MARKISNANKQRKYRYFSETNYLNWNVTEATLRASVRDQGNIKSNEDKLLKTIPKVNNR